MIEEVTYLSSAPANNRKLVIRPLKALLFKEEEDESMPWPMTALVTLRIAG